jgi:hypothetical protein
MEITITWVNVRIGSGKRLFSSDAGWSTLDKVLTCEKFASLRKVVFGLNLEMDGVNSDDYHRNLEFARKFILPGVNALFPMFRALTSTHRTLDIHLKIVYINLTLSYRE